MKIQTVVVFTIFCLSFLTIAISQEEENEEVLEIPVRTSSLQDEGEKVLEIPGKTKSSQEKEDDEKVLEIPVKRLLSRHRRFISPGTRWDWLVGWETLSDNFDIKFYLLVRYSMDYLFGGFTAYAAEIAGHDAAFVATKTAKEAVMVAAGQAGGGGGGIFKKRLGQLNDSIPTRSRQRRSVLSCDDNVENVLTRTVAHDQIEIFQKIEEALEYSGLPGRPCLLKTICDLKKTPIHDRHVAGDMITNFFMPKSYRHEGLNIYKKAEQAGHDQKNCEAVYPGCPISVFDVIPTFDPENEDIVVTFEPIQTSVKSKFDEEENKIDDLLNTGKISQHFNLSPDLKM